MISHYYSSYINIGVLEILSPIKYARFETLRVFNKETTHSHTLPISGGRRGKGGGLCAIRGGALDWRTSIPHDDANCYALECYLTRNNCPHECESTLTSKVGSKSDVVAVEEARNGLRDIGETLARRCRATSAKREQKPKGACLG
jgi:hypothetical protein